MTAIDRLVTNGNSIISTLKIFSDATEQDVTFTWIEDDDSETEITYSNIVKFQNALNNDFQAFKDDINTLLSSDDEALDTLQEMVDKLKTNATDISTNATNIGNNTTRLDTNDARNERADYCRRIEANLTMSDSVTFSSDKYLKWSNRLIAIGMGSDNGVYGSQGHLSIRVPATDTVIPGYGNATDVTVTDEGIPMTQWGSLYYAFDDGQDNTSKDGNWHYVGYNDPTGIIPTNWILVSAFNDDMDAVTVAGHTVQMGRSIYAQSVSDPVLGTNMQNVGGVIKDKDDNQIMGNVLIVSNDVDAIIVTDDSSAQNIVNVSFIASKDNPTIMVIANTGHAQENDTDQDNGDLDPSAGIGWKVGDSSDVVDDYSQFHGDKSTRENISAIGEFYVQDTILEYTANDGTFIYEIKPVGFSGSKQITCSKGDTVNVALFVQSNFELYWGAGSNGNENDTYRSNITVLQG